MEFIKKVENYLMENPNLKLSVRSISKRTGLRVRQVTYSCYKSKLIRKVNSYEVGSGKNSLNVFTYV